MTYRKQFFFFNKIGIVELNDYFLKSKKEEHKNTILLTTNKKNHHPLKAKIHRKNYSPQLV